MDTITIPTLDQIIDSVRVAVGDRDKARDELASSIEKVVADTLAVCAADRIEVGGYTIAKRVVDQTCCQGSLGSGWPIKGNSESHLIIVHGPERELHRSFGELDLSFFDGRNMQHGQGDVTDDDTVVRPATVAMLRAIAAALPHRIAELLAARQAAMSEQTAAAQEAFQRLQQAK